MIVMIVLTLILDMVMILYWGLSLGVAMVLGFILEVKLIVVIVRCSIRPYWGQ